MTRILVCGWETGDKTEWPSTEFTSNGTVTVVNTSPVPAYSIYCKKCQLTSTTGTLYAYRRYNLGANRDEVWARFRIYPSITGEAGTTTSPTIMRILDNGTPTVHLGVMLAPDGTLRLFKGAYTTIIATSAGGTATLDAWNLIEVRAIIHDTTGVCEVWLNGTRVINFSGDTRNLGNTNEIRYVDLGFIRNGTGAINNYIAYDDFVMNETTTSPNNAQPGDGKIVMLLPTGAGNSTQWAYRGGTDSGANWSQLDETPPSETDFIYDTTTGNIDLYALSNPTGVTTVNSVTLLAYCQKGDPGTAQLGLIQRHSTTNTEATAQDLPTSWGYLRALYETNPATAVAYTASDLDGLQAGVVVR